MKRGMTQGELSAVLGISQARISTFENGADMRVSTLQEITSALDLELVLVPRKAVSLVRNVIESIP